MTFERQPAPRWHREVPGSRWFKSDLHVHTIDDLPGRRATIPPGVVGEPTDPNTLREYAKSFLRGAVRAGVQVLGLTPHATKVGDGPATSAVWQIVEAWNTGTDEDGVPFREKVYAVFPGFEPNVNDGASGVHLLFLFDPEIGRDGYLRLFEAVMDGRSPWVDGQLRLTSRNAEAVCKTIDDRRSERKSSGKPWDYLVLAPHFQNDRGLLSEVKRQVLETFPCHRLAGYELGDEKLPKDFDRSTKPGSFLLPFMEQHRQAFFHASDAYRITAQDEPGEKELGYRTTWVKLASPRIEALRQAFIASESRLRIAYHRDEAGSFQSLSEPPDPLQGRRAWLRQVTVRGEAAFFGGREGGSTREVTVELSPDLTCIIGGSMTGKSTLLDGLRVHVGAEMPTDERLRKDVEERGRNRFLAGSPEITLDTPGHVTGEPHERWPAVFFTQNELQRLAQDPGSVEDILARLVPTESTAILRRNARLVQLDESLKRRAREIGKLLDQRSEAEQQLLSAQDAKSALKAFEQAGLDSLRTTEKVQGTLDRASERAGRMRKQAEEIASTLEDTTIELEIESQIQTVMERMGTPVSPGGLGTLHSTASQSIHQATHALRAWEVELERSCEVVRRAVLADRETVEKKLAELGHGAEKLAEFQALSRRAGMLASYQAACDEVENDLGKVRGGFDRELSEREQLVDEQRVIFDRVKAAVEDQFEDQIRVRRIDHGIPDDLASFLLGLNQRGITRWWNALERGEHPSPKQLEESFQQGELENLKVSPTVADRFREVFTEAKRHELLALRSPDLYVLELRVGDDDYREAKQLSGGKCVSLLLSLLLEVHDDRPLVIDQPEDQLDNRFLWETVLPALRRLKGRRQVIVATHNADIVVNGDADLVVQLEADADHGRVAVSGAIEEPEVRRAIIETVDGGEKAFELRKAKYGF